MRKVTIKQDLAPDGRVLPPTLTFDDKPVAGQLIQEIGITCNAQDYLTTTTITAVEGSFEALLEATQVSLHPHRNDVMRLDAEERGLLAKLLRKMDLKPPQKAIDPLPTSPPAKTSDIFSRSEPHCGVVTDANQAQMVADGWVPTEWARRFNGTYSVAGSEFDSLSGWQFGYGQEVRKWLRPGSEGSYYEGGKIFCYAAFAGRYLFKDVIPPANLAERFTTGMTALGQPESPEKWKDPALLQFAKDLHMLWILGNNQGGATACTREEIPNGFRLGKFGALFCRA